MQRLLLLLLQVFDRVLSLHLRALRACVRAQSEFVLRVELDQSMVSVAIMKKFNVIRACGRGVALLLRAVGRADTPAQLRTTPWC